MWSMTQFLLSMTFQLASRVGASGPMRFSQIQLMSLALTYVSGSPMTHSPDLEVTVPNVAWSPLLVLFVD
jgi:hypothetical protein